MIDGLSEYEKNRYVEALHEMIGIQSRAKALPRRQVVVVIRTELVGYTSVFPFAGCALQKVVRGRLRQPSMEISDNSLFFPT